MLARLQSLYLFLAALLAFSSMFFPFWYYTADSLYVLQDFTPFPGAPPIHSISLYLSGIVSPLTGTLAIATIFLYKNRSLQGTLIFTMILLFLFDILSGLAAAHFMNHELIQSFGPDVEHSPGAGFFVLIPEPLLFWLARQGVEKDEKIASAYKRL